MPVRRRSLGGRRASSKQLNALRKRLVDEWKGAPGAGGPGSPDILEEADRHGRVLSVYVTWDDWAKLDDDSRSEMIFEAFQEAKGEDAAEYLAFAMGMTKAEAKRVLAPPRKHLGD